MKYIGQSIFIFILLLMQNCENKVTISSAQSRNIANEFTEKIDGNELLPMGVKELLNEEQNFHNKDLWGKNAFSKNENPKYAPEANPKFPLPYYLIPATDAKFLYLAHFDPKVRDQLFLLVSGIKYFKLFVHPESEDYYGFLKHAYRYIGPIETEFMASPTSGNRTMIVWNKENKKKTPFIVKASLDKKRVSVNHNFINEVERAIDNQKTLNRIGKDNLGRMNMKFFPEPAGLIFDRKIDGQPDKSGGQLIREIPEEIINGDKKWLSFSTLVSRNHRPKPLIMKIIKQSGLTSYDFFEKFLINSYLDMYENVTLKNEINFEAHSQNLLFETTSDFKPTGKWILRDFEGVWTHQGVHNESNGPLKKIKNQKIQQANGKSNYISSYLFFYKVNIFKMLLSEVKRMDPTISDAQVSELNDKIDNIFLKKINSYLKLNLKIAPDISIYKKIERMILDQAMNENITKKTHIKSSTELYAYFEKKKYNQEWIELSGETSEFSDFYLTDHGIYEISNNKILGIGLFNEKDLENYKKNNGLIEGIVLDFQYLPREGCYKMIKNFFR